MSNTTFYDCCTEIAHKHNVPTSVVSANRSSYVAEAAELYADRRVEEAMRWVPVSERMPEIGTRCLILEADGWIEICRYIKISQRKAAFQNEQDEQPSICYPLYYKPILELPKPTQP